MLKHLIRMQLVCWFNKTILKCDANACIRAMCIVYSVSCTVHSRKSISSWKYIRSDIVYLNEQNKQNENNIRFHINETHNEEMLIRVLLSKFTSKPKIVEKIRLISLCEYFLKVDFVLRNEYFIHESPWISSKIVTDQTINYRVP